MDWQELHMDCKKCKRLKLQDEYTLCRRADEVRKAIQEVEDEWNRVFGTGNRTVLRSCGMDHTSPEGSRQGEIKGNAEPYP